MRMKHLTTLAVIGLLTLTLFGCAAKSATVTPQYNAAVVSNDFAHTMSTFQTEVISLHQQKLISDVDFATFKSSARTANNAGLAADKLIAANNYTSALSELSLGLNVLKSIPASALHITDPQSQQLYTTSLNIAISVLQAKIATTQVAVPTVVIN